MVVKVKSEVEKAILTTAVGDYYYTSNGLKSKGTIFPSRFTSKSDTMVSKNKHSRDKIICETTENTIDFYSVYVEIEENIAPIVLNKGDIINIENHPEGEVITTITFKKEHLMSFVYNEKYDELEMTYCLPNHDMYDLLDDILPNILNEYFGDLFIFVSTMFMQSPAYEELSQIDTLRINATNLFRVYVKKMNKHFELLLNRNSYKIINDLFRADGFEALDFSINKRVLDLMANEDVNLNIFEASNLLAKFSYSDITKAAFVLNKIGRTETSSEVFKRLSVSRVEDLNGFMNYYLRHLMVLGNIEIGSYKKVFDHEFLVLYFDYLVMADERDEDFELYPEDLKLAHDTLVDTYNQRREARLAAERQEKFTEARKLYENFAWSETIDGDLYEIVVPESPSELLKESEDMHNCVRTYVDRVCEKKCQICFMRRNGDCFMTIEVRDYSEIYQAKLSFNATPGDDVKAILKKWADEKKLSIKYY